MTRHLIKSIITNKIINKSRTRNENKTKQKCDEEVEGRRI